MNEPANFVHGTLSGTCTSNSLNNPPFWPRSILGAQPYDKTLCLDHKHSWGNHYDVHNVFGWSQTPETLEAVQQATGKRSMILSRSTFIGSGKYAAHWLGDNWSQWSNLHYSIIGMLEFNLFGIPYVGADICGFIGNSNADLCQRWMQLGAFYPYSRNHNGLGYTDQDPGYFGGEVARVSRETLIIRYTLLPYLYTLFYNAHVNGDTIIRPLFWDHSGDTQAYSIDRQFMWGSGLLISAVLDQGATTVNAYFPNARWYSYYDGVELAVRGGYQFISAALDFIPLHVRGGSILPTQDPLGATTTVDSRTKPLGLLVALDDNNQAQGDLFYDDGETLDTIGNNQYFHASYSVSSSSLSSTVNVNTYPAISSLSFGTVRIFGVASVGVVRVNGLTHSDYTYTSGTKVLVVNNMNTVPNTAWSLSWS